MGGGLASHHHRFGGSSATLLLNKVISSRCTRGTSRMTSVRPSWSRGKMTTFNAGRSAWKLNQRQVVSGLRGWPQRGQSLLGKPRRHSHLPPPPGLTWGSRRDQGCCESHPLCALRAPYVAARAEEEQGSWEQATRFSPGSGGTRSMPATNIRGPRGQPCSADAGELAARTGCRAPRQRRNPTAGVANSRHLAHGRPPARTERRDRCPHPTAARGPPQGGATPKSVRQQQSLGGADTKAATRENSGYSATRLTA